jgi:hypothetical protein
MTRDVHPSLLDLACSSTMLVDQFNYSIASPKHRCSSTVVPPPCRIPPIIDPMPGY